MAALVPRVAPLGADLVVAPALGGIVLGYEVGRQLGCRSIFVERVDGSFTLRRGFEIPPGSRIVVAEDVDDHRPVDPRMHRLLHRRMAAWSSASPASSIAAPARPISACR